MSEAKAIEDPNGRYLRNAYSQSVGRTSIYKCLDQEESVPADWNEIDLTDVPKEKLEKLKLFLSNYSHCSLTHLVQIYRAWIDTERKTLIYITEKFSSKTLRQYVQEVAQHPTKNAISKWCVQIINALETLHHCNPPIIHNHLSCDTIFIDASEGVLKLAVPSIESILFDTVCPLSSLEVHKNLAEPKSDVWSLGLCVMEMATNETPYKEKNSARDAILRGELPGALGQVSDPAVADFITNCLLPVDLRPSCEDLFESTLLSEAYAQEVAKEEANKQDSARQEASPSVSPLDELREKQKMETELLMKRQKEERKLLRARLRAAKKPKQTSLRDLLKEASEEK